MDRGEGGFVVRRGDGPKLRQARNLMSLFILTLLFSVVCNALCIERARRVTSSSALSLANFD